MSPITKFTAWLERLELLLDSALRRDAPLQMSEAGRRWLAVNLWWIAIVLGVLQLGVAWMMYRLAQRVERLVDFANSISIYGVSEPVRHLGFVFYFGLGVLIAVGLLLLISYQWLQKFKKQGWNLLYYAVLLNVLAGIIMIFSEYGAGFGDFVRSVVLSLFGAYFIFQVREYFTGVKDAHDPVPVEKSKAKVAD